MRLFVFCGTDATEKPSSGLGPAGWTKSPALTPMLSFLPSSFVRSSSPCPKCCGCGWDLRLSSFCGRVGFAQRILRDERRPQVGDGGGGDAAFPADGAKHGQLLVGDRRCESRCFGTLPVVSVWHPQHGDGCVPANNRVVWFVPVGLPLAHSVV